MKNTVTPTIADDASRLYTTIADSPEDLEPHLGAWDELAECAVEPNPFYEPYALLAAWRNLAPPGLRVVLVWMPNALPGQPPHLAGLFPITRSARYKGLPIVVVSTWHHLYTYLGTPLVRADRAVATLEAFLAWARSTDAMLFELQTIRSDGAFGHALIETLRGLGLKAFHESSHTRALFRPAADLERYLDHAMSGKKRKELRRQERRLGESGSLVYDQLEPGGDLERWLEEFLELEALGWKGQGGTALKTDRATLEVFRAYARGAMERGRWVMLALRLDGRAIAMKCNLLGGDGAVAFKIAYDESYSRFSPGVLLELEQLRRLHAPGAPGWMDSGAAADHPMIGHLWRDRVAIETLVIPSGHRFAELTVAALPLVRFLSGALRDVWRRVRIQRT
ncbi:MAG: GNAT family N-acetyltransferase [Kofleriaceae bacterium]